jgi:hypothetical protein
MSGRKTAAYLVRMRELTPSEAMMRSASAKFRVAFHVALEQQFDAEFQAAVLQDVEHLAAADADEAVAGRADLAALEHQLDVVPMVEGDLDRLRRLGIPLAHRLHGGIGKDHPPAKCIESAVALDDSDLVFRVLAFHEQRKVEPGRSTTDTDDPHVVLLPRSGCACRCQDACRGVSDCGKQGGPVRKKFQA